MAVIRNLVVKIAADISSLSKGLQDAQKKIQKVSASFTKAGTKLTASITAPLLALGGAAVNVSQQFEQSMANAASVAGATGDDFARMTALAREMGSKTVFSASQAADALYYMASAGYKVDQMADSIQATLNLASATQSDLAFTTDTVISTLNQFGLEANQAERVTNVFAAAIGNSMANMDKLSNSMGYVGPVANSLGYSIEETTGALAVLYNAGYDGSTAGTALRQSLVSLMNPSTAALGVFEELGLTYDEVNPATNDLATIIDRLGAAGMDTSQAMKVFGARAGPGMLALLSAGGDAVRDMTASITGTNKATEMAEDWSSAWEYMQSFASNIWSGIKNIFLGIWEFIKGFGENICSFFGNVGETIGNIFKGVWEGISGFFTKIWDGIKNVCGGIWDSVTGVFGKIKDFFTGQSGEATSWGSNLISNITGGIKKAANWVVDGVKSVGKSIANFLGFGSPTKKGPGHTADEWIPNLMDMMASDMYENIPMMQRAAIEVANTLGLATSPNRAMVGTGSSPNGDLLNGLLQGMAAMNGMGGTDDKELVLQIDGQTFARLMLPKLSREYKRNGVNLQGV